MLWFAPGEGREAGVAIDPLAIRDLQPQSNFALRLNHFANDRGARCPYSPNTRAGTTIGRGRWVEPWPLRATRTLPSSYSFRRLITPIGWSSIGVD